jgi:sugar lactone lactonase YvrE
VRPEGVKRFAIGLLALLAVLLLAVLLRPTPIDPVAWTPPRKPRLQRGWAPNHELLLAQRFAEGKVRGPEDVALDDQAGLYTGTADGKIRRVSLLSGEVRDLAVTGGRPLGLRFDPRGRLIVCDAVKGLLAVDPEGRVETLVTEAGGRPFRFTNNLDIARDGTVYFSDASDGYGPGEYLFDLLEARPHGRLLRYDPVTARASVVLEGLHFANGVALSGDESFVAVAECYRYQLLRHWLKGPQAGRTEVMAPNLPGFPDNLSRGEGGNFWVAFFTVRNDTLDALHPHPFAKKLLSRLPRFLWPKPARYGLVALLDPKGRPLLSLHDPAGERVFQVTTAREHQGVLYLGTLESDWLARYTLRRPFVPLRVPEAL